MPTYAHDDDRMWIYQEHTRAKHEVVQYYSDVWTRIVSAPNRRLRYFDCFAGRGDYVESKGADPIQLDEITTSASYPGSPQIFLDQATKHSHLFKEADCYFFEPNITNREHLCQNLDSIDGLAENVNPHVIDTEFEESIDDTIRQGGGYGGFGLFFMDPFGLSSIPYEQVTGVTSVEKFDCIITLMTSELIRWRESEGHEGMHETVYGTPDWRDDLFGLHVEDPVTAEAEYYSRRLQKAGTEYSLAYMLTEGDTRRLKYHLVFTSNDERGFEAIRDSMMYCGTPYTLAYAPEHPDFHAQEQTQLSSGGILTEEEKAKAYLRTKFSGESLPFGDLVQQCYLDRPHARSLKKDYRQYLKDMDNEGEVKIPQRDSEEAPLKNDYEIHFPADED